MIKVNVSAPIGYTKADVIAAVCEYIPITADEIRDIVILRSSLDISDRCVSGYSLTVGISASAEKEAGLLKMRKRTSEVPSYSFSLPRCAFSSRPVVVGAGPCGLFAALLLAEAGAEPIVIERGECVEERGASVDRFRNFGILNPESNVQFGEGGAGAYSDGKLKVGSMDKYKMKVLSEFVASGGNEDIMHSKTAHLGTDKLPFIVREIREKIKALGGEFMFSTKLVGIDVKDKRVKGIRCETNGAEVYIEAEDVILAVGHSARDTVGMLNDIGMPIQARGFGIGVRIEHPREYINELVYGKNYDQRLETASYHLVTHLANGRSAYSFCMCPGGTVVAATSEPDSVVTNGMSEYKRDGRNSNAAFLISVTPQDFGSDDALAGMRFQEKIEKSAFRVAGSSYKAPALRMGDFVKGEASTSFGSVTPTYPIGTEFVAVNDYMPQYVDESLRAAIGDFDKWMPGFYYPDAVLTGAETRTTSPIRISRGESYEAVGFFGIYPAGEGAGYSGGIVSSAVDGLRCAESVILRHGIIGGAV